MDYSVKSGHPEKQRTACLVAGVFEPRRLSGAAQSLDQASGGVLSSHLRRGDLEGRLGQTLMLHNLPGVAAERVLLVGCGREKAFDEVAYRQVVATAARVLNDSGAMEAGLFLTDLPLRGRDGPWRVRQAVEAAVATTWR